MRSKIGWLAGSRDSHHVSRFAAFFILARAEISVDGSCFGVSRFLAVFFAKSTENKDRKDSEVFKASFPLLSSFFLLALFLFSNSFEGIKRKRRSTVRG